MNEVKLSASFLEDEARISVFHGTQCSMENRVKGACDLSFHYKYVHRLIRTLFYYVSFQLLRIFQKTVYLIP